MRKREYSLFVSVSPQLISYTVKLKSKLNKRDEILFLWCYGIFLRCGFNHHFCWSISRWEKKPVFFFVIYLYIYFLQTVIILYFKLDLHESPSHNMKLFCVLFQVYPRGQFPFHVCLQIVHIKSHNRRISLWQNATLYKTFQEREVSRWT